MTAMHRAGRVLSFFSSRWIWTPPTPHPQASEWGVQFRGAGTYTVVVKVGPPVHNYEHEAGSYGDGFT
jgi:hypothetical protein